MSDPDDDDPSDESDGKPTPADLDAMVDEVDGLVFAWVDRGIDPAVAAQALIGRGAKMLITFGAEWNEVRDALEECWRRGGGKP